MGMQSHVIMHPSLQVAKGKTQHKKRLGQSGSSRNLRAVPGLSSGREGGVKNYSPLNGVLGFWTVVLEAAVLPECGLLGCFCSGISEKKGCKGCGPDLCATIDDTPKSVK